MNDFSLIDLLVLNSNILMGVSVWKKKTKNAILQYLKSFNGMHTNDYGWFKNVSTAFLFINPIYIYIYSIK